MGLKDQNRLEATPASVRANELMLFDTLSGLTRKNLHNLANAIIGVVPDEQKSWVIQTSELISDSKALKIISEVHQWAGRGSIFLYYLQVIGQPDLNAIRKAYSDSRARDKGKRAYARLIKNPSSFPPTTDNPSPCFYVGSSLNISLRLKEHLGYGAKATFSLQLAHWAKVLDLKLKFICAKYRSPKPPQVYQALEDTLWDQLQPIFGRKGAR